MQSLQLPQEGPLRILALGAHPDDIEIGAGATIHLLAAARTVEFTAVVLTSNSVRAAETKSALQALLPEGTVEVQVHEMPDGRLPGEFDQVKDVLAPLGRSPWDIVFAPHSEDAHQDHALLGRLAPTALRDHLILHYEIPKWDGDLGRLVPNLYVPISPAVLDVKWDVLDTHHVSQRGHDWWSKDVFAGLARLRGMECRSDFAEAFRVNKFVVSV